MSKSMSVRAVIERKECRQIIDIIVQDIAMALTGKEWTSGGQHEL